MTNIVKIILGMYAITIIITAVEIYRETYFMQKILPRLMRILLKSKHCSSASYNSLNKIETSIKNYQKSKPNTYYSLINSIRKNLFKVKIQNNMIILRKCRTYFFITEVLLGLGLVFFWAPIIFLFFLYLCNVY